MLYSLCASLVIGLCAVMIALYQTRIEFNNCKFSVLMR